MSDSRNQNDPMSDFDRDLIKDDGRDEIEDLLESALLGDSSSDLSFSEETPNIVITNDASGKSSLVDEAIEKADYSDSNPLNSITSAREFDDESLLGRISGKEFSSGNEEKELDAAIERQVSINQIGGNEISATATQIIPNESDVIEKRNSGPGDEKTIKTIFIVLLAFVLLVFSLFVFYSVVIRDDTPAPRAEASQIGINSENNVSGETIGGSNSSGNESNSDDEKIEIPSGGSKVTYYLKTEGDIKAASVSYLDGDGSRKEEAGVVIPWNKSIGARESLEPRFAATSTGNGVLTCSIVQDGKKIAEKTVSGDSPTISCG